jgi:hypothetical protein
MHRPTFVVGILTLVVPTICLFLSVTYLFALPLLVGIALIYLSFRTSARRLFWYYFATATFVWAAPYALIAYGDRTYYVEMVVPRNYAGILTVIRDSQRGSKLEKVGEFYRLDFSESPTIYSADPWVFFHWNQTRVINTDGKILVDETSETKKGSYELKGLGTVYNYVKMGPGSYTSNSNSDGTKYRWDLEPLPNHSLDPALSSVTYPAGQDARHP